MKFWHVLLKAFLHALTALTSTILIWAIWAFYYVILMGHNDVKFGGPWGTYRFVMFIAIILALILSCGFLVVSLICHLIVQNISLWRKVTSAGTLTLTSLALWPAIDHAGTPLIVLLIALPILSAIWMIGRAKET